ncbi:unnamed protein product [Mesocestoides corti]|uniref:EGF-like domain-containing protein n=1 Tax=Mesocestoides corti TaxID=53468 RepID=A0A0R3UJG2_MESCO|nr:unnamed protein product [Mesocestoides corti]
MNGLFVVFLACLASPSLACYGNGCNGRYNFQTCTTPVCHYGKYIGYGCRHGICPVVCLGVGCRGVSGVTPRSLERSGFYGVWGNGAYGHRGCYGGNCGYWAGCLNGRCGGYYDFRRCRTPMCVSGPYHGYGCANGVCRFICFQNVCHTPYAYGLRCYGPSCDRYYQLPELECNGVNCREDCTGEDCEKKETSTSKPPNGSE